MSEKDNKNLLSETLREGMDSRRRRYAINTIIGAGLDGSPFMEEKEFSEEDVVRTRTSIMDCAKFAHPKVFPGFWEHLCLVSIYARRIASKAEIEDLDPIEAECLGLKHDLGKLVAPDRYYRADLLHGLMDREIGVRTQLSAKLPPIGRIIGRKPARTAIKGIEDMSFAQRVMDVADNLGKRNADGTLFSPEQMVTYVTCQPDRYKRATWPSVRFGLYKLEKDGKQDFATNLVLEEIKWLEEEFGIDFKALREEVLSEFNSKENQDWILRAKNNHESLDPRIDEILGRPSINTVVFDFGDVLCEAPDEQLIENLAIKLGCSSADVFRAFSEHNGPSMGGKISEVEYLKRFYQSTGREMPENMQNAREPFVQPEIYRAIEGMREIIKGLSENPNVKIYVLSDAIRPLAGIIREMIAKYYPEIDQENIFISSEIGESKREPGAPAFQKMIDILKGQGIELNPESTLFIDDREKYTTAARAKYGIRGLTFRGDGNRTPSERFKDELLKAGLI